MVINDLSLLVDYILSRKLNKDEIEKLIKMYGDIRVEGAIERSWSKAMAVRSTCAALKRKHLRDEFINFDYDNGVITQRDFIAFVTGVEDELDMLYRYSKSKDYRSAAADIQATIRNRLGDVRIDRRILFKQE